MTLERNGYTARQVRTKEEYEQCRYVRKVVFCQEQGYSEHLEDPKVDLEEEGSVHFILLDPSGKGVGTVRVFDPVNKGKLGRLAILKEHRGKGLGYPLCTALHEYVKSVGGKEVICDAQAGDVSKGQDSVGFYKKMGYVERGEWWLKHGIGHQVMVLYV